MVGKEVAIVVTRLGTGGIGHDPPFDLRAQGNVTQPPGKARAAVMPQAGKDMDLRARNGGQTAPHAGDDQKTPQFTV
ncbi:hypothetical protein AA0521_2109 [Komagataeibacter intermedius NRIC 0521]|uniref:Uncharacterized protein n=1 Tax=Komagataeibacter intermedius NRIC 0521 TaxID=1307934 RepID=A0ABQ0PJH7_9PROT|nr:hypothetical protein AA0521_2109 [Komagataeibacter intermedius NRIC 0521]